MPYALLQVFQKMYNILEGVDIPYDSYVLRESTVNPFYICITLLEKRDPKIGSCHLKVGPPKSIPKSLISDRQNVMKLFWAVLASFVQIFFQACPKH